VEEIIEVGGGGNVIRRGYSCGSLGVQKLRKVAAATSPGRRDFPKKRKDKNVTLQTR